MRDAGKWDYDSGDPGGNHAVPGRDKWYACPVRHPRRYGCPAKAVGPGHPRKHTGRTANESTRTTLLNSGWEDHFLPLSGAAYPNIRSRLLSTLMNRLIFFTVCLVLLSGCRRDFSVNADENDPSPGGSGPLVASLNVPFELDYGQEAVLDETNLRIEFSMLAEDSRCAVNVDCIHAGRAGVILTVLDGQSVRNQLVAFIPGLVATPYQFNDIIQFQDLRFRLLRVDPYPREGITPTPADYSILLQVEPTDF